MLIGLAHDRIVYLGMSYIDRGWITQDEYEICMIISISLMKNGRKWFGEESYVGSQQTTHS